MFKLLLFVQVQTILTTHSAAGKAGCRSSAGQSAPDISRRTRPSRNISTACPILTNYLTALKRELVSKVCVRGRERKLFSLFSVNTDTLMYIFMWMQLRIFGDSCSCLPEITYKQTTTNGCGVDWWIWFGLMITLKKGQNVVFRQFAIASNRSVSHADSKRNQGDMGTSGEK